jgi:hypothetical protein
MVGFMVRVDKGNNTKGGFDKKIIKGLTFMQTYIDKNPSFHPIGLDKTLKPIKEKGDMTKYQVMMRNYFSIPNQRAFDNMSQGGGRMIKGLAVMGFTNDPQRCLNNAAGDLRMMGCTIFYKSCQELDMVATQILVRAPNTIEEEIVKQTMDKELKAIEKKLLLTDKNYKLTRKLSKSWIEYAVIREFSMEMPWEGTEEKKQKQRTTNARLVYILHMYQANYKWMKTLLACAKKKDVWHKHGGNAAFTIELPDKHNSQEVKTKYIQMVQTHGSV